MTRSALISSYHELAGEYYDAERHPTSANFRDGSVLLVERWVDDDANPSDINWDVGAGDSVLAEVLNARGLALDRTTALDSSPSMLAYSEKWSASGLRLLPGDATQIPAADASAALVLASL